MKISETCPCGSEMLYDSDLDKKKDWKAWIEAHKGHKDPEPKIKGTDSDHQNAGTRRYEKNWWETPVVFGFVPNEINARLKK